MTGHSWFSNRKLAVGAVALTAVATLAVDTYPVILNDSISYLSHSAQLAETGLVSSGYRQVGYPLWLAFWRSVGSPVEPMALISLAQRGALVLVTLLGVWKLRGPGMILVAMLMIPTYAVYSNLLLTEALGVPLAALAAVLLGLLLVPPQGQHSNSHAVTRLLILAAAGVVIALVMVRFHYVLIAGVLMGALILKAIQVPNLRRFIAMAAATAGLVILSLALIMSFENRSEYGEFFPTIRGERVQFWTLWQVVVQPNQAAIETQLPEVYLDGNPYTFMGRVDTLPYAEVKERYRDVIDSILEAAGTTIWTERARAVAGVLTGGRIDDLKTTTAVLAEDVLPGELEGRIHRNNYARKYGPDRFNDVFNGGRVTRGGMLASGAIPQVPLPHVSDIYAWFVPAAVIVLLAGLALRESRLKAMAGLAVLASYVLLAGWFILDNFRFLLPAYVVLSVLAASVIGDIVRVLSSTSSSNGGGG